MAQQTIPANDGTIASHVGSTPSTGPFAVDFPFFSLNDVIVTRQDDGAPGAVTLTRGADYSLTGVTTDDGSFSSGTVTLVLAVANTTITRTRDTPVERLSNFPLQGFFSRLALNAELNKMTVWMQEHDAGLGDFVADLSNYLPLSGGTMTGPVELGSAATVGDPPGSDNDFSVANTRFVRSQVGNVITGLRLLGTWNATTNTPTLASGTGLRGDFYICSVAGTTSLDGITSWAAGDSVVFNGVSWQRVPQTLTNSQIVSGLGYTPLNKAGDSMTGGLTGTTAAFSGTITASNIWRLLQRSDVVSAVADVKIQSIASDINDLKFTFDLIPASNAQDLVLQFYDNANTLISTGYLTAVSAAQHGQATGSAPLVGPSGTLAVTSSIFLDYPGVNRRINNGSGIHGSGTIANIRAAARIKSCDFQSSYISDDSVAYMVVTGSGMRNAGGAITGFRLSFSSGNVASGTLSIWGSP